MRRRTLLIALAAAAVYGALVVPAQAELHRVAVKLVTGQTVTVTVDVPPGAQVTPAMLGQLPATVREAYQQAITSGVDQVFLWGAAIAVAAVVAAWFIHEVPLRGTSTEPVLEA